MSNNQPNQPQPENTQPPATSIQLVYNRNNMIRDYLRYTLAGRTMGMHIQGPSDLRHDRNVTAWNLIHICFAFYQNSATFISEEDFQILLRIVDLRGPYLSGSFDTEFLVYLYHYVVGRF